MQGKILHLQTKILIPEQDREGTTSVPKEKRHAQDQARDKKGQLEQLHIRKVLDIV